MRTRSPGVQARITMKVLKKKQELAQAHRRGIILGAWAAAKVAKKMIESGWTDMKTLEAEVWRRVRAGKK